MLKNKLAKNAFSLLLLKGFEYLLPLLTVPYLVRVLGNEKFGEMSYAIAISYFFVMITNYGFDLTATRQISIHKEDMNKVKSIFSSVLTVKILLMLISFGLLFTALSVIPQLQGNNVVYYIAFFNVIGNALFPIWLFQGIEKMEYITGINMFAKISTTLLIFIIVREPGDYVLATLLQSIPFVICAVVSFIIISRKLTITYVFPNVEEIVYCFKDGWNVFTSAFMSFILTSGGILILGIFTNKEIVGIYSAIEKLAKAIINLFTPITQALFPYISEKFGVSYDSGKRAVFKFGKWIITLAAFISIVMMIGAKWILLIFYGDNYVQYSLVVQLFAIWLFTSIFNNIIGIQYLVASGKSNLYSKSFLFSTIITLTLFLALTPKMHIYGILIGINAGELILTVVMLFYAIKNDRLFSAGTPKL
ncbi:flippase [Bacillus sp. 3G2]|uniref:flippase n=1 Tax=Bacillus sp. 3G2 TaxID=3375707 RepID=UPI003786FC7A